MSSHALTPFIGRPDSSFGGVSGTNFIGRCDPVRFDPDDLDEWTMPNQWFRFPVCDQPDGMQAFFDVCVPVEGGILSLSEAETCRLLCHTFVQHLPDLAFGEAVEALIGIYEFYRASPALPAPPTPRSIKSRVTGSYAAPVFPVLEE